jgi:hypothetical protein
MVPSPECFPTRFNDQDLGHIVETLRDTFVPTDEDELRDSLHEAGYRESEVDQLVTAWAKWWRTMACSTCGNPATHRFGCLDVHTGDISSMDGLNRLSLSCDECCQCDPEQMGPIVRAPIRLAEWKIPTSLQAATIDHKRMDQLERLLNKFDNDQMVRDAPFMTTRPGQSRNPVERVQRALDWIQGLREVPFR